MTGFLMILAAVIGGEIVYLWNYEAIKRAKGGGDERSNG
jgi:hypothetical protein